MTITAALPPGVEFPEKTLLTARVWRTGDTIQITAETPPSPGKSADHARSVALEAWLSRCAAQPASHLTDEDLDDLRWQYLKEKHQL